MSHGFLLRQGRYSAIDDPKAARGPKRGTLAIGINDQGDIVGNYDDSGGIVHGFLLRHGRYIGLDDPKGVTATSPNAINANGDIVGIYVAGTSYVHGFLLHRGTYTTVDDPAAKNEGTYATSINQRGDIVGTYDDSNTLGLHGFLLHKGAYTTIDDPNAVTGLLKGTIQQGTEVTGINARGNIVGSYVVHDAITSGFLLHPTT